MSQATMNLHSDGCYWKGWNTNLFLL